MKSNQSQETSFTFLVDGPKTADGERTAATVSATCDVLSFRSAVLKGTLCTHRAKAARQHMPVTFPRLRADPNETLVFSQEDAVDINSVNLRLHMKFKQFEPQFTRGFLTRVN